MYFVRYASVFVGSFFDSGYLEKKENVNTLDIRVYNPLEIVENDCDNIPIGLSITRKKYMTMKGKYDRVLMIGEIV